MTRKEHIFIITKRLIILSAVSIAVLGLVFAVTLFPIGNSEEKKFMVSWVCLIFGIIGGFVSIQQRLNKMEDKDLELLSGNMFQILLIPIYGGIFAGVLYLIFLGGFLEGPLFPEFDYVTRSTADEPTEWIRKMLSETYPKTTQDFAKLFLWSFIAGFSERFVPQVISNLVSKANDEKE